MLNDRFFQMKQLAGLDAGFVHLERGKNKFQVGTLLFYDVSTARDSFVRFKDILNTFEKRISRDSLLRKKLKMVPFNLDHPYWVNDPDFDIEYHVRHIALPKPGDWRQLCILIARMHARKLDFDKPLWEAYVIEGLDNVEGIPPGGFAIYFKLHHAAIDGIGGNDLVTAIHDLKPFPEASKIKVSDIPVRYSDEPGNIEILARAYLNFLRQPTRMFELGKTLIPAFRRIQKAREEKAFHSLGPGEYTRFNGRITNNMVFDAAIFDFSHLKEIKDSVPDVTVNDVMLAIVSGAMQAYLAGKKETPKKDLSVGMPINIRPFIDSATAGDSSNLVSVSKVNLHSSISRPLERLQAIHTSAVESKAYQNAMGAKVMLEVGRSTPALLASLAARALPNIVVSDEPMVNTVVTNVPGSQEPLYMGGARLAGMCNIGLLVEGMGLFHAVSSYCGTATVSFQADRKMMPDPENYKDCVIAAFNELLEAARAKKKFQQPARKPRRASRNKRSG
jgi:diacylglycerol O-acyltransferase / wax synthase